MFDSLDTMLLMGLKDDFNRALIRVGQATWSLKPVRLSIFMLYLLRGLIHHPPLESASPILRDRNSIPWRSALRLRAFPRADLTPEGGRAGSATFSGVRVSQRFPRLFREHRNVSSLTEIRMTTLG